MTESTEPANPPGESAQQSTESQNGLTAETTSAPAAIESSFPALPTIDSTLPAIDKTMPPMDSSLPAIDSSIPAFDSSVPALPSIDTSLPPLDTTLPAEVNLHTDHSFFSDMRQDDTQGAQSGDPTSAPGESNGGLPQHADSSHASTPANQTNQPASNGTYHYSQQSAEQPQPQPQQHQPPPPQPQGQEQQPQQQQQAQQNQQPQAQSQQQYQQYQQYQPQQQPQQYQQAPQQQYQPQQQQYQQPQQYQQQYQQQGSPQAGGQPMNTGHMDHNGVQGQQAHVPQAPIGSPMPANSPPMPSAGQYMTGYPTNVSQMNNAQMRYQLPGDPNKMLSGSRHKKEVKRRTKTGCLTCRKRRIKCDEGHPVCRNCVKSKRDCLGYDPVFRPQSSTPSAIQPAPNPSPSLVVTPQEPPSGASYPAAPPGYVPAVSQPFAPSLPSESSAPSSTEQSQFNYSAAIDPSLEQNNNSGNMASVQHATTNLTNGFYQAPINASVKQVQISDLLALRGIPPPPPHPVTALPPGRLEEIQAVFLATYAPAIDRFFETPWFQEKALPHVMANAQLMAEYSALIDAFNDRNLEDPNVVARLESFEASVIWSTITLCRHVMNMANGNHGQDFDLLAASKRLDVMEALLTGDHVETNPLEQSPVRQPAADPPALTVQITQRSLDFWSCLGHFLTLHDNEASSAKEIDDTLARCRTLLDTTENRDVIYSIAIARHLGQRWADFPHSLPQPITTNEKDAGAKLYVAQKFLEQQANGSGTTQVSKRICGMAVRSWFVSRE